MNTPEAIIAGLASLVNHNCPECPYWHDCYGGENYCEAVERATAYIRSTSREDFKPF